MTKVGHKTICPLCGYEWSCKAKTTYVTCPGCMRKFVPDWKKAKEEKK